jgi:hypothetical protein
MKSYLVHSINIAFTNTFVHLPVMFLEESNNIPERKYISKESTVKLANEVNDMIAQIEERRDICCSLNPKWII